MTVENISIDVKTNAGSAAKQFRSLSSALAGVRGASKSVTSSGNKTSKSVSSVGRAAKSATGAMDKLFASIKRIAFYRLLRTFIKELSQAFQEGLKNVYAFSKAVGGNLSAALDRIASASGQMKNQMGAAFGELLMTIEPIITAIVGLITTLMNALSALFAALGGRFTYTVADQAADSWDKATGSAKKYKNTVLGFDELNRLNDESGGGGGGGADTKGIAEIELPDWAKKIAEEIERGDWKAAGDALAVKINEVFDNWDAEGAGQTLGSKINNAINFAFGYLTRLNTTKVGEKVATFLNGAIGKVNFSTLGATLTTAFTNAIDFLIGFITTFNTFQLGESIKNFIVGAFNKASEWLDTKDFKLLGNNVMYKIIGFFNGLDPAEVASSVGGFISKALTKASDFIRGINFEKVGKAIGDWFKKAFENVPWDEIAEGAWTLLEESMGAVGAFSAGLIEGVLGREIEGFVQEMTRVLSDAALVIGAILALTGANIPLGLGLMVAGLAGRDKANEDWEKVPTQVQEKISAIELAASTALLALGIILAISGAALPLGLGLIAAGATMLATSAKEDWNKLPTDVQTQLTLIGLVSGVLMLALGIILLLSGVGFGIGIGLILASVAVLGITAKSFDPGKTTSDLNGDMESIGSTGETEFGKIAKAINGVIDAVKSVIDWFSRMKSAIGEVNNRLNDIKGHQDLYGPIMGEVVRGMELGAYASGGMPEMGSLFVAGEAGAELVTNMGNGRTGVTNVEQMEAAVANGNTNVVNAVYAMANMIVKAVNEIDPDITLDGQSLADKMYDYNRQAANRHGAAMVTLA